MLPLHLLFTNFVIIIYTGKTSTRNNILSRYGTHVYISAFFLPLQKNYPFQNIREYEKFTA